jgi:hypothetical protein
MALLARVDSPWESGSRRSDSLHSDMPSPGGAAKGTAMIMAIYFRKPAGSAL